MNTELNEISATVKEIKIEIPAEEVRKAYDRISANFANKAQIPGFRKGFAPLDVVRMRFKEEIKSDVIQALVPNSVTEAILEHQISPIAEPNLQIDDVENIKVNGSQPLTFSVHVEIMPEIPSPEYEGLEVIRRVRPIEDEMIETILDDRLQQEATLLPVEDRKSENGDTVIADLLGTFEGDEDSDPIEINHLEVKLGDESIEASFSENLVGVEEDDEKEFTVNYPEDFSSSALAGRTVNYKAKIKSVGRIEVPELDDEWVKSLDEGFETVDEINAKMREDMETMANEDAELRVRNDLVQILIENNEFEVPRALIESQAQNLLNNFAQDLANQGVDLSKVEKDVIEMTYQQMLGQAEKDVRGAILLEEIVKAEKIEIADDEINEEVEKMAAMYQTTPDDILNSLEEQGGKAVIENNLRTRKAIDVMLEKANISDGEWIDEQEQMPELENVEAETQDSEDQAEENIETEEKVASEGE